MRGFQLRLFLLTTHTELVELELPWLMKEAAGLKSTQIRSGPHSSGSISLRGGEITPKAKSLAFGG